jgi:hypothetical protein
MRTHDELLAEARRIGAIGELYADEYRRAAPDGRMLRPRVIPTFVGPTRDRWVEAAMVDGTLEYRLVEAFDQNGRTSPRAVFASDSAFDTVAAGDQLEEKERLIEALEPIIARIERHEFAESVEPLVAEEIEMLIDADELDPVERLKTKAEIVEFLAGRLEPTVFVADQVERRCRRHTIREAQAQRPDELRVLEQL